MKRLAAYVGGHWRAVAGGGAVVVIVVVAAVVAGLGPALTVECTASDAAGPALYDKPVATTQYLLDRQVVVIGPAGEVAGVVEETAEALALEPLRTCAVHVRRAGRMDGETAPFARRALRNLALNLYQIGTDATVEEAVGAIEEAGEGRSVYADPNYLTGFLAQSPCGRPDDVTDSQYEVAGSPYEVAGSQYEVAGSPYEVAGSTPGGTESGIGGGTVTAAQLFWKQWALEQIGAGPGLTEALRGSKVRARGAGVRVAVFDTSPFGAADAPQQVEWQTAEGQAAPFEIQASSAKLPTLASTGQAAAAGDLSDHGLFVSGLIHALAPESEIHLVRVLDEHGCGDLESLTEAVLKFTEENQSWWGKLGGVVINLSLGVHKPAGSYRVWEAAAKAAGKEGATTIDAEIIEAHARQRLESLQTALWVAHGRGAVIVAAAGNDSYVAGRPLPPQVPAEYPFVIGVEASNVQRQRSCFSNWGDVAAPGGDGGPGTIKTNRGEKQSACAPATKGCSGNCPKAVISRANSSASGYAYWSGTSFSAPLVSGLAALVLESGRSWCHWPAPDRVLKAVRCGTQAGDGVIDVPDTLGRCRPGR